MYGMELILGIAADTVCCHAMARWCHTGLPYACLQSYYMLTLSVNNRDNRSRESSSIDDTVGIAADTACYHAMAKWCHTGLPHEC